VSEFLPRSLRLLLGATSAGVSDDKLRHAVEGRSVLITGASSGVGRASARRIATAGATALLVARRAELLEELEEEIRTAGGRAFAYPCNMADTDAVGELVSRVLEDHGHVDVVVSNAGLSIRRWISESYGRFHDFERTTNVNYLGPVRLVLGLLPSMRERGSGHIVSVSTVGVDFPPLRWSAYIASKAAFEVWLSGVAPEVRADGVTTTSIHLQLVRSPMLGPFKMWNYVPGMSTEEAAGIVARAIAARPRTISPPWARFGGAAARIADAPIERAMAAYTEAAQTWLPDVLGGLGSIAASRTIRPIRPDRLARAALAARRFGASPATVAAAAAELYGDRPAAIDELGIISFADLDAEGRSIAGSLHSTYGLGPGDRVAIMCRNHRGFLRAAIAGSRLGCDLVPLNNEFAGPQLGEVLRREQVTAAVHDEEFEAVFDEAGFEGARIVAWHDEETEHPTLVELISDGSPDAPPPDGTGRVIMLTSGTTGTPKGAARTIRPLSLTPMAVASLLDLGRIRHVPESGAPFVVAPPLFHLFGLAGTMAAFALGSPVVLRRRFDAEAALEQIERHRAGVLLAVPTMLARIMALPDDRRDSYDTSSLKMIVSGAAPLPPELAKAVMARFGDVLYNGYSSTETASGTLATPADLRTAPGTVGKPMAGVKLRILDDEGRELPCGETGRIFLGSPLLFEGYTGGGGRELIDGLMSTGDLGHLDPQGRLYIDGRDDDMILSGGENVFPQEVEDLLSGHDAVADAAVFGVSDEQFGQRLAASVVLLEGASASEDELKDYVRSRLARHKVPREIEFVADLPRTSTGKLRRRELASDPR
jgi:acyl-CoA synthetase (AMP-forming)/AMP-acid ligase II/NAD(P)-dependent dehydrogenase (short-subunit alcohol dehydrogenase family)